MGLFSDLRTKWKASNAYESALKHYGINPRLLPVDLHLRVCSYTNQQYERTCKMIGRQYAPIDIPMKHAASLVAICVLGQTKFSTYEDIYSTLIDECVVHAARQWKEEGPDSCLDSKIIQTVSEMGAMSAEFANSFSLMIQ